MLIKAAHREEAIVAAQYKCTELGSWLAPLYDEQGSSGGTTTASVKNYPRLYDMVEINQKDWGLLPTVSDPGGHALVPKDVAVQGYIPGLIIPPLPTRRPGAPHLAVVGVDGKTRRWVR